jgi:hypothetical protein
MQTQTNSYVKCKHCYKRKLQTQVLRLDSGCLCFDCLNDYRVCLACRTFLNKSYQFQYCGKCLKTLALLNPGRLGQLL